MKRLLPPIAHLAPSIAYLICGARGSRGLVWVFVNPGPTRVRAPMWSNRYSKAKGARPFA